MIAIGPQPPASSLQPARIVIGLQPPASSLQPARAPRGSRLLSVSALLACALCQSCNGAPSIEGSLGEQVSLAFDTVQLQHSASAMALLYLRNPPGGGGQDTVLKLTAATQGLTLDQGLTIDLTEKLGNSLRGAASRAVGGDARRDLPPIVHGSLTFDSAPAVGKKVTGHFNVLFGQGGSVGAGRTVFGNFSATVTEAGQ